MVLDLNTLSAAKLWLISDAGAFSSEPTPRGLPYLAHALYALISVESAEVARATCDDGWRVYLNPTWLEHASIPEVAAELAHLTWHLLSDHAGRARSLGVDRSTAILWKDAADAAVAQVLDADGIRPEHLRDATELDLPGGRPVEEYYAMISKLPVPDGSRGRLPPADGCGSGADGIPRTHELGYDSDLDGVTRQQVRVIRERVAIEYREHIIRRGSDPGDALRWIQEVVEPALPWEQVLRAAVRRAAGWAAGRGDYTYSRPSRRAGVVPQFVLPGQRRPLPRVSVVVDTSASVDDGLLGRALAEIDGVIRALGGGGASVTAYSVDAAVHATTNLRSARDAKLIGAGGTDLRSGLAAVEGERPRPDVVIVLTDGDTPWPENPPPGSAIIVVVLGRRDRLLPPTPQWAVRVECVLAD